MGLTNQYKIGVKRQIVEAIKPLFGPTFPIPELASRIYVGLEYPYQQVQYPAIYITFSEGPVTNVGVGHFEDGDDYTQLAHHFSFTGTVNFNVIALTSLDRDRLSAALVDILAFGKIIPQFKTFHRDVGNGKYIQLHLLTDSITPGGEQIGTVPWASEDEQQYGNSYSVPVFGDFLSDSDTGGLVQINEVLVTPYRHPDELPPW